MGLERPSIKVLYVPVSEYCAHSPASVSVRTNDSSSPYFWRLPLLAPRHGHTSAGGTFYHCGTSHLLESLSTPFSPSCFPLKLLQLHILLTKPKQPSALSIHTATPQPAGLSTPKTPPLQSEPQPLCRSHIFRLPALTSPHCTVRTPLPPHRKNPTTELL